MYKDLIEESEQIIKTATRPQRYQTFLDALKQQKYDEALLLGCKYSDPADSKLTELLCTLIRHAKTLPINVNRIDNDQKTPIDYAIKNTNYNLHYALKNAKAQINEEQEKKWTKSLQRVVEKITAKQDKQFKESAENIQKKFNSLPHKSAQKSDAENAEKDMDRLYCILNIIEHLQKYHGDLSNTSFINGKLSPFENDVLYNLRIAQIRICINWISTIVANLSGSLRKKYVGFLKPLDWITLEQLGGIIKEKEADIIFMLSLGTIPLNEPSAEMKELMGLTAAARFIEEYSESEELIECAVTNISADLPALKKFFKTVAYNQLYASDPTAIPTNIEQVKLPITRIITRHFNENKFLVELLRLLNYKFDLISINPDLIGQPLFYQQSHLSQDALKTPLGQHAFLRKLQRLGEIFTGKNTDFSEFDQTIDYQAVIHLRDFICHQDESHNKHFIDELLQEPNKLQQIYDEDLPGLMEKIGHFIDLRDARYGGYHGDAAKYWAHVLQIELGQETPPEELDPVVQAPQRRATVEKEEEFKQAFAKARTIEAFKNTLSDDDAEKLEQTCCGILAGTVNAPDTKERGQLLKPFAIFKKTDKSLYEQIVRIMTQATTRPSTTEDERVEARKKLVEAAKQRLIDKENRLTGLTTIRTLVAQMEQTPERQHQLNPVKRIAAAIEAANNIKLFLVEAGYLKHGFSHTTMEAWDEYNQGVNQKNLVSLLLKNHLLNDALEYNAGQLLQQLETIRGYKEADFCQSLKHDYEALRSLRNYIEHGHPLIESYDEEFNTHSSCAGQRQKIIAPELIKLVFVLLPDLQKIKTAVEKNEAIKRGVSPDLQSKPVGSIDAPTHLTLTSTGGLAPLVMPGFFGRNRSRTTTPTTPDVSSSSNFSI